MNKKLKKSILSLSMVGILLGAITTQSYAGTASLSVTGTRASATTTSVRSGNQISTSVRYEWYDAYGGKFIEATKTISTSGPSGHTVVNSKTKSGNACDAYGKSTHNVYGSERYNATRTRWW